MTATVNTNVSIGNDSAELLTGASVGFISGSGGNDTIQGAINGVAPGSTLDGGLGDDSIYSRGIGDIALGGAGDDVIRNDSGQAELFGGADDDTITSEDRQTTVYGGAGDDSLLFEDRENVGYGDAGDDTIIGLGGGDIFAGGDGDDYLKAATTSNDASILFGNMGDDTIILSDKAADSAFGGQDSDYVFAGSNATADGQFLFGNYGDDVIEYLGKGKGVILDGDRAIDGVGGYFPAEGTDAGADSFILASSGTDLAEDITIAGGGGNDSISGGTGAAGLLGAGAAVYMGKGDDYFNIVSSGSSLITGDLGNDSGSIVLGGDDTIFGDGAAQGEGETLGDDNFVLTGSGGNFIFGDTETGTDGGNDTLDVTGLGSGNVVSGGGGDDYLRSGGGNVLIGGEGNDIYELGEGDTVPFDSLGVNTYVAGSGVSLATQVTVNPTDSFTGGATFIIANDNTSQVKFLESGGIVSGDEADVIDIKNVDGKSSLGGGNDTFTGAALAATGGVDAGDGNDLITFTGTSIGAGSVAGGAGDDIIEFDNVGAVVAANVSGGDGNDTLTVAGTFTGAFDGGAGDDVVGLEGTTTGDFSVGGNATLDGGDGNDKININSFGTDAEGVVILGGAGNDIISAERANGTSPFAMTIDGEEGDDIIYGKKAGGDVLNGGAGNDTLFGGGIGKVAGTSGSVAADFEALGDTLTGGDGKDVFILGTNKLGFAGDSFTGTSLPAGLDSENYVFDSDIADTVEPTTGFFNGVLHVDVITDFNPAEDKIIIATAKPSEFQSGSIGYLSDSGELTGIIFGSQGSTGAGSDNTVGIIGDAGFNVPSGTFSAAAGTGFGTVTAGFNDANGDGVISFGVGSEADPLTSQPSFPLYLTGSAARAVKFDGASATAGTVDVAQFDAEVVGTTNVDFALDNGGTGIAEINFNAADQLTLDVDTGALYYNAKLITIFDGLDTATLSTINQGNFVFAPIGEGAGLSVDPTIL